MLPNSYKFNSFSCKFSRKNNLYFQVSYPSYSKWYSQFSDNKDTVPVKNWGMNNFKFKKKREGGKKIRGGLRLRNHFITEKKAPKVGQTGDMLEAIKYI